MLKHLADNRYTRY